MERRCWTPGAVAIVLGALTTAVLADVERLPADPSLWQRLETLPPTPRGTGYLDGIKSGDFVQFRYAVPEATPRAYLVHIDNIVAMHGGGTSYQVEIHIDSPDGPLLYKGAQLRADAAFNAEDLSRLDATALLTDRHIAQGHIDVWATVWVEGDAWTTYRDADGTRWDIYALVPDPEALARWERTQRQRDEMLRRGVSIVPHPQRIELLPEDFRLGRATSVALVGTDAAADLATAELLRRELGRLLEREVPLTAERRRDQISLVLTRDGAAVSRVVGFDVADDIGEQGYALEVKPNGAVATAHTTVGLWYAAQTLAQLARREGGTVVVRGVRIVDWPDLEHRMVQYDIARGNTVNVEYWKRWIRELSRLKINEIMLYMEDDWHSEKHPYLGRPDTFTPDKARVLVEYARQHHVELVPQLESLGHAGALLSHEELRDLRLGGSPGAICPHAERALPVLDDLFGELSEAFPQSSLFHVGADEVWGFKADSRCAAMVEASGEEGVYAFHLNNLHALLTKRSRKMAFWGDEVLSHPKVADSLTRDAVVFDWHYGDQKAYPSIKFFQDLGFQEIYVCPAVHGYFDVYPTYRQAFGNIRGFTRAGVEHGVAGVCCTTWGTNRGGNAENYLYGLAYAAECAWSSTEADRDFFDERFPTVWLGVPWRADIGADIDRAFWFAWREAEGRPFWQRLFQVSRLFFGPYEGFQDKSTDDDRRRLLDEAHRLETLCQEALEALARLRADTTQNLETISALEHAVRVHRHVAAKCTAMCELALDYRAAYVARPQDPTALASPLGTAITKLGDLQEQRAVLEAGIQEGIGQRCGDPHDMRMFLAASEALDQYLTKLGAARAEIANGKPPASPAALGLGAKLLVRIGRWRAADVNPSDAEHPRTLVFEVTGQIPAAGRYEVEWDYTAGPDGLDITSTSLCVSATGLPDDLAPIATDEHHSFTGAGDRDNRYTLVVEDVKPDRRYFVVGTVYNQRDFDTSGDVWLKQDWAGE